MLPKQTVRLKLLALSVMSAAAALVTACVSLAAYDYFTFRQSMVDDVRMTAQMAAENVTAALSFNDAGDARQVLSAVGVDPKVTDAAVFDNDGRLFADFHRGTDRLPPANVPSDRSRYDFGDNHLMLWQPVQLQGKIIGTVFVRTDLGPLNDRARGYVVVFGTITLCALAFAVLLSTRISRRVLGPILELSGVMRRVSDARDYSLRATHVSDDELGTLVRGFNEMLDQIQQRDAELIEHRIHLEERVRERTAELVTAKERAEEASRAKTSFLANMSHEIRTPMAAVLGYADLMLAPTQTMSDRINCLQVVRRNARHLMDLINDILDISKIEAEKMTVEQIPVDPAQVVVEVASLLRPKAMTKGLMLNVEFAGPIPDRILSDALRLKQVVMNLVGNAIKFTHAGGVRIKLSVEPHDAGSRVRVDVVDTGIGMTTEQVARLFRPFVQADESMTRKYGGSGLGLVISKRLATFLGGDLVVASAPGSGSTFTVVIEGGSLDGVPMRHDLSESMLATAVEADAGESITLSGKILLAEDGIDNQHLLTTYLVSAGAEVTVAENGQVAIDLLSRQPFNVVLMDMQMPVLDGYSAATRLRRSGCQLPIVALTAHAMSGDRAKCLDAGCTDYLTKPVDRELLVRTVDSYLRSENAGKWKPAAEVAPPRPAISAAAAMPSAARTHDKVAEAMRLAIDGFIGRLPARVQTLLSLTRTGDLAELGRAVHQLKGSGTGYGFPQISQLALRAESAIKAGHALDDIKHGVDELIATMRGVKGYDVRLEANHV